MNTFSDKSQVYFSLLAGTRSVTARASSYNLTLTLLWRIRQSENLPRPGLVSCIGGAVQAVTAASKIMESLYQMQSDQHQRRLARASARGNESDETGRNKGPAELFQLWLIALVVCWPITSARERQPCSSVRMKSSDKNKCCTNSSHIPPHRNSLREIDFDSSRQS